MQITGVERAAIAVPPVRLLLTPGDPAGIGPDLAIALALDPPPGVAVVAVADPVMLAARARLLGCSVSFPPWMPADGWPESKAGHLPVWPVPLSAPVVPGQPDSRQAAYLLATLNRAADACVDGTAEAMVTGPLAKSVIADAGHAFSGHTEYLAERVGGHPVMMLAAGHFRVALVTTHLALKDVAAAVTQEAVSETIRITWAALKHQFGIVSPRILVCGLNPHAGESGHLGREEIEVIVPALQRLAAAGMPTIGPLPADTLFTPRHLAHADAVVAMYHDQGLPVLKHAGFGQAVNITLGLPIVRTSVDHGTAFDLAGTGRAEAGSLIEAVGMAARMARGRRLATGTDARAAKL